MLPNLNHSPTNRNRLKFQIATALVTVLTTSSVWSDDCIGIIEKSRTIKETVYGKERFESEAANFCREYSSSSAAKKSEAYNASYKFISAGMNKSSASEKEIAEKVCQSNKFGSISTDAFREYLSSINDNAYPTYETCTRLKVGSVSISLASLSKSEMTFIVSHGSLKNQPTSIQFSTQGDASCIWESESKTIEGKPTTLLFPVNTTANLKCKRIDTTKEAAVIVVESGTGANNSITVPWKVLGSDGIPKDLVSELLTKINTALEELRSQSRNAVVAFKANNINGCPDGWQPYQNAYGRFVRGIDLNEPEVTRRLFGSIEEDAIKSHTHRVPNVFWDSGDSITPGTLNLPPPVIPGRFGYRIGTPRTPQDDNSLETRPKNVALLYCEKR